MVFASMSARDPALIRGLAEQLAANFSARVDAAIPEVADFIESGVGPRADPAERQRTQQAAETLLARRHEVRAQVAESMQGQFNSRLRLLQVGSSNAGVNIGLESMTLMADERLDEEIAINQCGRWLKEQCDFELWALTRRMAILFEHDPIADMANPAFPQVFAQALMEALGKAVFGSDMRQQVFKAFRPVLLDIVPAVYHGANDYLRARGIDIDDSQHFGRPVPSPSLPPAMARAAEETSVANQDLSDMLRQLLTRSSTVNHVYVETAANATPELARTLKLPVLRDDDTGAPAWRDDLTRAQSRATDAADAARSADRALHDIRQTLQEKLDAEQQVIADVVTVLFDRLRTDPRIVPRLRDVVARLQIPLLELALQDRSLLMQVDHPVRRLIDLIGEFGLALELAGDDDVRVLSVENIVDGLVHMRNDNPDAFRLAHEQLDMLFHHHEEASLQTDESVRALERAEALEFAGTRADRELALRLQNRLLPPATARFISVIWRGVLAHDYLRGGARGEAWKLGLTTLDELLKSLQPATTQPERERLARLIPDLVNLQLHERDLASHHQEMIDAFHAELKQLHRDALDGKREPIQGERFVAAPGALDDESDAASPGAIIADLGIACGDWIETRDGEGDRRWRLNWITTIRGTCVLKHYESGTVQHIALADLKARFAAGEIRLVRGLGLADEMLQVAFDVVSRKLRRAESALPGFMRDVPGARSPGSMSPGA